MENRREARRLETGKFYFNFLNFKGKKRETRVYKLKIKSSTRLPSKILHQPMIV